MSPADVAAVEALTGTPLADAIDTAVREESLAEEIELINAREDAAAASDAAKRATRRAKQSAPTEPPAERRTPGGSRRVRKGSRRVRKAPL